MKSDYLGPLLKLIVFAVIILTIINDVGSVISTHYRISDQTEKVAKEALRNYTLYGRSTNQAMSAAKLKAELDGARLTGFQVTREVIRVSVEIPAKSTWVAHRIKSLQPYLSANGQYDIPIN